MKALEDLNARKAFAEHHGLRLMATTSAANFVNIDYDLSPEPDYRNSLEERGCREWREWAEAREEELSAMRKFKVYRVVKTLRGSRTQITDEQMGTQKKDERTRRGQSIQGETRSTRIRTTGV